MTIKARLFVTHVATGKAFLGEWQEIEPDGVEHIKTKICDALPDLTYLTVGNSILPGDFLRNHCVLEIITA